MTHNKFISLGMPGDECCSCEPILMSNLIDINYCGADLYATVGTPCDATDPYWTGDWPGEVCSRYPIVGFPQCVTGDGARIVQVCQPIATDDGHCRNTTIREYPFTIKDSGKCEPPWYIQDVDCVAGTGLPAIIICISDDGENEDYPNPNQCCSGVPGLPAPTGNGTWFFKCSGEEACRGSCSEALHLDGSQTPAGFCAPYTCCPCPAGGSRNVAISVASPSGDISKDFTIPYDTGICDGQYGSPGLGFCYSSWGESVGQTNQTVSGERYGATGLQLCDITAECSGQRISLSLCCCDTPGAMGASSGTHDCHVCNYQFTMSFVALNEYMDVPAHEGVKYCFCPDDAGSMWPPTPLVPGDTYFGDGQKRINEVFTLVDGSCQPFFLEYVATGLYWNCDCLLAGDREDLDNRVTITATIT